MNKEHLVTGDGAETPASEKAEPSMASARSRRRWISGAGVGAVLLSIKSGSALAQGVCASPSGFKSIEANPRTSHRPQSFDGNCHSHGWYRGNPKKLGTYRYAKLEAYNLNPPAGSGLTKDSNFEAVIKLNGDFANARDLITVLVDFLLTHQDVVNKTDVQFMWARFYGGYSPLGSKFEGWSNGDIRAYLDVYVGDNKNFPPII